MLENKNQSSNHLPDNRIHFIKFMIGIATLTTFALTIAGALQKDWLDAGINFGLMIIPICLGVLVAKKKSNSSIFSFFVAYVFSSKMNSLKSTIVATLTKSFHANSVAVLAHKNI